MQLKEKILAAIFFVVAVVVATFVVTLLSKKNKPDDNYELLIKAKDDLIQVYKEHTEAQRVDIDRQNAQLMEKDSLLQIKEKTIIREYKNIPVYINSLDKDKLRSAIEAY